MIAGKGQRMKWGLFYKEWAGKPIWRRQHSNRDPSDVKMGERTFRVEERPGSQGVGAKSRERGEGGWGWRLERQAGVIWRVHHEPEALVPLGELGSTGSLSGGTGQAVKSVCSRGTGSQLCHFTMWTWDK